MTSPEHSWDQWVSATSERLALNLQPPPLSPGEYPVDITRLVERLSTHSCERLATPSGQFISYGSSTGAHFPQSPYLCISPVTGEVGLNSTPMALAVGSSIVGDSFPTSIKLVPSGRIHVLVSRGQTQRSFGCYMTLPVSDLRYQPYTSSSKAKSEIINPAHW
jgi:hypothetical protein